MSGSPEVGTGGARIGFVTCVELGRACIEAVLARGGRFALLMTLEDAVAPGKSGRVCLDDLAAAQATPLLKVRHINDAASVAALRAARLDWLFIVGWSQIAAPEVLAAARHGAVGMHPTLLPEGRGRAAIPWAILKRLPETGVTMFKLDAGVDSGPVIGQRVLPLAPDETATTLYARVTAAHGELMQAHWDAFVSGSVAAVPQDEARASRWPGRKPEDGRITPTMTVADAECLVRAVTRPYPGAFIDVDGRRLRIWAGHPVGTDAPESGLVIPLADGAYMATDWAWEPLP